MNVSSISNLFF